MGAARVPEHDAGTPAAPPAPTRILVAEDEPGMGYRYQP